MFDKLIELLITWWDALIPVYILQPYEEACVVHFGRMVEHATARNGLFRTGIHFKVPLASEVMTDNVVPGVCTFEPQVAMTKDGKSIVAKVILMWSIKNIVKAQLDVEEIDVVLPNVGESVVLNVLNRHTLDELYASRVALEDEMLKEMRKKAGRWGIKIHSLELTHLAEAYILRLVD